MSLKSNIWNDIIYDSTRSLLNLGDKLSISTVFIFCYKLNIEKFAELLYTDNHKSFIQNLNNQYKDYEVEFTINLDDKNVKSCFYATLKKVQEKFDKDGYYKALYNKDEFAISINGIMSNLHT